MAAWRGIGGPKGLPQEVVDKLIPALKKAWDSAEFQEFMNGRGFGLAWAEGDEFAAWMADSDANLGEVMQAVGLAK